MKKLIALALALAMVFTMVACGSNNSSAASANEADKNAPGSEVTNENMNDDKNVSAVEGVSDDLTLRVAVDGEPDSLFPGYQQNKVDNRVNSSMFNYLTEWDDVNKTWKYSLATEHEWVDDTHIKFTIRDDVYFSNGEKLVAEDVAMSLAYQATESTHASYNFMFDPEGMEVIDDTHVIVGLTQPYGNLMDILGCDYYTIFDWSAFEADGKDTSVWTRNPVGSGPYMLEEWKSGESITLVRNENYWDKENMPYYKRIVYYFIPAQAGRASALKAGTVDVAYNLAINQVEELEEAGITVNPYNQNVTQPLQFTMTNKAYPALQDENVRKAIMYAIDKNALAEAATAGYGISGKSSLFGPNSPYYYECETFTQDLEIAQAAMDDAIAANGWTPEDLTFVIYAPSGSDTSQLELLKYYLEQVGITINIEQVDIAVMLFDHLFVGDTAVNVAELDTWDINRMLNYIDSRVEGSYDCYVGEYEEELHKLIDAAKTADDASRYDAYAAVQQFCADHYVCTPINNCLFVDAWSSEITGMMYDAHCWPNVWAMRPAA